MSGSSGGGGGGIGSREVSCDALSFRTQLASPVPGVVATLAPGQILQVLVTIVEARGLRPPADDSLRVYEPDVDWAWGGSWRCRGICWRGLC